MLQIVLQHINQFSAHMPWDALVASGVLSPLLVGVKKWFSVQSEKVMISLVILFAMLAAAANYLLHVPVHDPSIIALQGAVLGFMTQPVYFFIVKPAMAYFKNEVEKAAQFNLDVKSAATPASGLPVPQKPVEVPDFSH